MLGITLQRSKAAFYSTTIGKIWKENQTFFVYKVVPKTSMEEKKCHMKEKLDLSPFWS